jgi:poly(3-hydroxybutyrate) depolymerase
VRAHAGIIVLAPDSCGTTWDRLQGANGVFGPDIAFIGAAMTETFALYNVDPARLAIQGFSDGATYALALGASSCQRFTQ